MKDYTNATPVFHDKISIYESTDPVDADSVDNVPLKQLQDNALALQKEIGSFTLATEAEVANLAEDLMNESGGPVIPDTATDEEVDEMIGDLVDL